MDPDVEKPLKVAVLISSSWESRKYAALTKSTHVMPYHHVTYDYGTMMLIEQYQRVNQNTRMYILPSSEVSGTLVKCSMR